MEKEVYNDNTIIYTFESQQEAVQQFQTIKDVTIDAIKTLDWQDPNAHSLYFQQESEDSFRIVISLGPHAMECMQLIQLWKQIIPFIKPLYDFWEKRDMENISERLTKSRELMNLIMEFMPDMDYDAMTFADELFTYALDQYMFDNFDDLDLSEEDVENINSAIAFGITANEDDLEEADEIVADTLQALSDNIHNLTNLQPEKHIRSGRETKNKRMSFAGRIGDIYDLSQKKDIHGEIYKANDTYVFIPKISKKEENMCIEFLTPYYGDVRNMEKIGKL